MFFNFSPSNLYLWLLFGRVIWKVLNNSRLFQGMVNSVKDFVAFHLIVLRMLMTEIFDFCLFLESYLLLLKRMGQFPENMLQHSASFFKLVKSEFLHHICFKSVG